MFWYIAMFLLITLKLIRYILVKWRGSVDKNNEINVKGKRVVITGCTSGIGKATALEMAFRDANVILACRDIKKAVETVEYIRRKTCNGQLIIMELDLASLESVRNFANEFNRKYERLDVLILNAGVMSSTDSKRFTKDGFEFHFGVNHLGHFLLTNLLLESLKNAVSSRVVTVSSTAHSWGMVNFEDLNSENTKPRLKYMVNNLYANSKLCNALFNKELAKRMRDTGVKSYALCPGMVFTEIGRDLQVPLVVHLFRPIFFYLLRSPAEGASTVLYCALSKNLANQSGQMYRNCKYWDPAERIELSDEDAARLWLESEKLVGLSN